MSANLGFRGKFLDQGGSGLVAQKIPTGILVGVFSYGNHGVAKHSQVRTCSLLVNVIPGDFWTAGELSEQSRCQVASGT